MCVCTRVCAHEHVGILALTHQETRILTYVVIGLTAYKSFKSTAKTQTKR